MEKILLVEDNKDIMSLNTMYLNRQGYITETAYTVREAEEKLAAFQPDLIILDVMLPDGDGMELCRKIRKSSGIPILFLTAKASQIDIVEGLETGGDEYLTKPYELSIFGAKIKALLRRTKKVLPQSQSYFIGPITIDIIQSQVYSGEESLKLSRTEFGIILYLSQNQGKTVTKEELYRAVWGIKEEESGNMLWTAISRLKRKLQPYEQYIYIDSDHKGYELVVCKKGQQGNKL